jgi:hypothetical protein
MTARRGRKKITFKDEAKSSAMSFRCGIFNQCDGNTPQGVRYNHHNRQ